ncbi:MAG: hypothetical protein ACYDCP_03310 [Thermoplasmataceae archaeon]|jgi:hypothetical protein
MRVVTLGLINWQNNPIDHNDVIQLAKLFFDEGFVNTGKAQNGEDGWYIREVNISDFQEDKEVIYSSPRLAKVGISHSRIIIEQEYADLDNDLSNYRNLSDIRHKLRKGIYNYVNRCVSVFINSRDQYQWKSKYINEIIGGKVNDARPFVFLYQVIMINENSNVYLKHFKRLEEEDWDVVPFGIDTTCFFGTTEDTGAKKQFRIFGQRKVIHLRVSGTSLMLNTCSRYLEQKIINILYLRGLYAISREQTLKNTGFVYDSLELLLEDQGHALVNELGGIITQEKIAELNSSVLKLTAIILILSAILVVLTLRPIL